jgi:hypothetical protein
MRRIQIYLEDDLWAALDVRSQQSGLSISKLAQQALRERYLGLRPNRSEAMQGIVGIWKDRPDIVDSASYVRRLRRGTRPSRIAR